MTDIPDENNNPVTITGSWAKLSNVSGRFINRITSVVSFFDKLIAGFQKLTKDILTEDDGKSFCGWKFGMALGIIAVTVFMGYQVFFVAHALTAELIKAYAEAIAYILGGGGGGLAAKQWSQGGNVPPGPDEQN